MKSRKTNQVLNTSTCAWEKPSVKAALQGIDLSKEQDVENNLTQEIKEDTIPAEKMGIAFDKEQKKKLRTELKAKYGELISSKKFNELISTYNYPYNLLLVLQEGGEIANVKERPFKELVESCPIFYRWIFEKIFKDKQTVDNVRRSYYGSSINTSQFKNYVCEALYNLYFAVCNNYSYSEDDSGSTYMKIRRLPLNIAILLNAYNSLEYNSPNNLDYLNKMLSEVSKCERDSSLPMKIKRIIVVFNQIFVLKNTQDSVKSYINNQVGILIPKGIRYTIGLMDKDINVFMKAVISYIGNKGELSFNECIGAIPINGQTWYVSSENNHVNDFNESNKKPEEVLSKDQIEIEDVVTDNKNHDSSAESKINEERQGKDDSSHSKAKYEGLDWKVVASLCKNGFSDIKSMFDDPFYALSCILNSGVSQFPDGSKISLAVISTYEEVKNKLSEDEICMLTDMLLKDIKKLS